MKMWKLVLLNLEFIQRRDYFRDKIWYILMGIKMCYETPEDNWICQWDEWKDSAVLLIELVLAGTKCWQKKTPIPKPGFLVQVMCCLLLYDWTISVLF